MAIITIEIIITILQQYFCNKKIDKIEEIIAEAAKNTEENWLHSLRKLP
jgi:hypothetical protein